MNKKMFLVFFALMNSLFFYAQNDTLKVYYYENFPYAYTENGALKGIEIEIIQRYANWMKLEKNIPVVLTYKGFKEFSAFYSAVKDGNPKVIGVGSVTNTAEREKEVAFSPSYMRNIAVLITDGYVPTIKNLSATEVSKVLEPFTAMAVNKSTHLNYLNDVKAKFLPGMKISATEVQTNILDAIAKDGKSYGYVDIVAYWAYLKSHPNKFLKIQKVFNRSDETLGFILPFRSSYLPTVNEFFEKGFGFTSTKMYREVLEKYLGYEIIESVEIK